jgi:uncharacterized membrane protein
VLRKVTISIVFIVVSIILLLFHPGLQKTLLKIEQKHHSKMNKKAFKMVVGLIVMDVVRSSQKRCCSVIELKLNMLVVY